MGYVGRLSRRTKIVVTVGTVIVGLTAVGTGMSFAATGDAMLDFGLAFHCRQRERFVNATNVQNAPPPKPPASPAPAPGGNAAAVAPYVDLGVLSNDAIGSLADISKKTGLKNFALAFVTAAGCAPRLPVGDDFVTQQIAGVRAAGGDVIMSFGGASGQELAQACTEVKQLQAVYAGVVRKFGLKAIDMDVEGPAVDDTASIDRRSEALAGLQKEIPGLKVSLTLPVQPTGLAVDSVGGL